MIKPRRIMMHFLTKPRRILINKHFVPVPIYTNVETCHGASLPMSGRRGSNPRFSDTVPTTFCDFVIRCKWVNYIFHKRRFWLPFVSFLSQYKAIKITDFQSVIEGFDAPFPIRKKRCIFFVVSQRTQNFVAKICCKNMHFLDSKS